MSAYRRTDLFTPVFVAALLLSVFHQSLAAEDIVWAFSDDAKVTLNDTKDERLIVDQEGQTLIRLHQSEVVRSSVYNEARTAVALLLAFKSGPTVGVGSVITRYQYSRVVIVKNAERLRVVSSLAYNSAFMKGNGLALSKIISLSDDASEMEAEVGTKEDGKQVEYKKRRIRLLPPMILE